MKKSDIKPGMAVELRNGYKCLAVSIVCDGDHGSWVLVSTSAWALEGTGESHALVLSSEPEYAEDMASTTSRNVFDIMKVYDIFKDGKAGIQNILNIPKGRKLLWERQEAKEMTLAEIETALGHPVKIVKEK